MTTTKYFLTNFNLFAAFDDGGVIGIDVKCCYIDENVWFVARDIILKITKWKIITRENLIRYFGISEDECKAEVCAHLGVCRKYLLLNKNAVKKIFDTFFKNSSKKEDFMCDIEADIRLLEKIYEENDKCENEYQVTLPVETMCFDKGMSMKKILVTPEIANKLLENNKTNRNISNDVVRTYVRDMAAGNWKQSSTPLSIGTNGQLLDGQHRLTAVIKANKSIPMWVCYNVPNDAIFDTGKNRTVQDILKMDGVVAEKFQKENVTRLVRYIIKNTVLYSNKARSKISAKEVESFILANEKDLAKFVEVVGGSKKKLTKIGVHVGIWGAIRQGVDLKELATFYKTYLEGFSKDENDYSIIGLRNYVLTFYDDKGSGKYTGCNYDVEELARRTQYAIQQYLAKSKRKKSIDPKNYIYDIK